MSNIEVTGLYAAALGSALLAGGFFAFSTFIMPALARLPSAAGIAAMQSINVVVLRSLFLVVLMGTTALCAVLAAAALILPSGPADGYCLAGCVAEVLGVMVVTMVGNVPLNNQLAGVEPGSVAGEAIWRRYLRNWTLWNHTRALAGLAATGAFIRAISA
ncbi:MAG: DUF1772 domain-containing protein [Phycisphaerales bacterium]|nr:DUF1772 domain-containing protein [Phycisphaerales bacterium]